MTWATGLVIAGVGALAIYLYFFRQDGKAQTGNMVSEDRSIHYSNAPTTTNNVNYNLPVAEFQPAKIGEIDQIPDAIGTGSDITNVQDIQPVAAPAVVEQPRKDEPMGYEEPASIEAMRKLGMIL